jgi:FkbH-like protein
MAANVDFQDLKGLLLKAEPLFWSRLAESTQAAETFAELLFLSSLRKKALNRGLERRQAFGEPVRLALVGGYSLYPLSELLEHYLHINGVAVSLFTGDYDNYAAEIGEATSELTAFRPEVLCILPSPRLGRPTGSPLDGREALEAEAKSIVRHLLGLCAAAHERSGCEIALANFPLPGRHDLGAFRARTLGSEWSFRKLVNLELGLSAPPYVHVCDLEFLTNRRGAIKAADERAWFESKQLGSPDLIVDAARELANIVVARRRSPKKVLVVDLDNTLWGGVIGDDGLEGIEIGDTSARGEAFKTFQRYLKGLTERGVLLAVCSKNERAAAEEPFEKHPEMVLRLDDFAAFYADWEPKSDNLRRMAEELNLGLDSFVFVDDNAAEIDIVRQFAPEVTAIHLGPDPAQYCGIVQDCRLFEPLSITTDDTVRTGQYRKLRQRNALLAAATDMDAYLESLEMEATISPFAAIDVPRLAQLINKSNQFNLTTRRRSEAEVAALIGDSAYVCFSVRLKDRFGDHGLISIVIGCIAGATLTIDTWLMSCRVLKRQVEEEVLNEIARSAAARACARIVGVYSKTAKNEMVKEHYPALGFAPLAVTPEHAEFTLDVAAFTPRATHIRVVRKSS